MAFMGGIGAVAASTFLILEDCVGKVTFSDLKEDVINIKNSIKATEKLQIKISQKLIDVLEIIPPIIWKMQFKNLMYEVLLEKLAILLLRDNMVFPSPRLFSSMLEKVNCTVQREIIINMSANKIKLYWSSVARSTFIEIRKCSIEQVINFLDKGDTEMIWLLDDFVCNEGFSLLPKNHSPILILLIDKWQSRNYRTSLETALLLEELKDICNSENLSNLILKFEQTSQVQRALHVVTIKDALLKETIRIALDKNLERTTSLVQLLSSIVVDTEYYRELVENIHSYLIPIGFPHVIKALYHWIMVLKKTKLFKFKMKLLQETFISILKKEKCIEKVDARELIFCCKATLKHSCSQRLMNNVSYIIDNISSYHTLHHEETVKLLESICHKVPFNQNQVIKNTTHKLCVLSSGLLNEWKGTDDGFFKSAISLTTTLTELCSNLLVFSSKTKEFGLDVIWVSIKANLCRFSPQQLTKLYAVFGSEFEQLCRKQKLEQSLYRGCILFNQTPLPREIKLDSFSFDIDLIKEIVLNIENHRDLLPFVSDSIIKLINDRPNPETIAIACLLLSETSQLLDLLSDKLVIEGTMMEASLIALCAGDLRGHLRNFTSIQKDCEKLLQLGAYHNGFIYVNSIK